MKASSWFISQLRIPVWKSRLRRAARCSLSFAPWCAVWLLTAVILLIAYENWRGGRAWRVHEAEARAAGDFFEIAPLIPSAIPDAENFGTAPIFQPLFDYTLSEEPKLTRSWTWSPRWRNSRPPDAFKGLREIVLPRTPGTRPKHYWLPSWRRGELPDFDRWREVRRESLPTAASNTPAEAAEELLQELRKFDSELQGLREANRREHCRFPLHYEESPSIVALHYGLLQNAALFLYVRTTAELSLRQIEDAREDQLLSLRLQQCLDGEPVMMALLLRINILDEFSLGSLWTGMAQQLWREEDLAAVAERLSKIDLIGHFGRAVRFDRNGVALPVIDRLERERDVSALNDFVNFSGDGSPLPPPEDVRRWYNDIPSWQRQAALWAAPAGWFDRNKVAASEIYRLLLGSADSSRKGFKLERVKAYEELLQSRRRSRSPYTLLGTVIAYGSLPMKCAFAQARVNLASIAVALERHRIQHGAYPETLADLDSRYLAASGGVPADPASGNPPHYKLHGTTFDLYYDGWNAVDDGGVEERRPNSANPELHRKGDWIWPVAKAP